MFFFVKSSHNTSNYNNLVIENQELWQIAPLDSNRTLIWHCPLQEHPILQWGHCALGRWSEKRVVRSPSSSDPSLHCIHCAKALVVLTLAKYQKVFDGLAKNWRRPVCRNQMSCYWVYEREQSFANCIKHLTLHKADHLQQMTTMVVKHYHSPVWCYIRWHIMSCLSCVFCQSCLSCIPYLKSLQNLETSRSEPILSLR